jgi:hypothetical protein
MKLKYELLLCNAHIDFKTFDNVGRKEQEKNEYRNIYHLMIAAKAETCCNVV